MAAAASDLNLVRALQQVRLRERSESLLAALAEALELTPAQTTQRVSQELGVELDSCPTWAEAVPVADVLPIAECRRIWACPARGGTAQAVFIDDPWMVEHVQRLAEATGALPRLVWSTRERIAGLIDALAKGPVRGHASSDAPAEVRAFDAGRESGSPGSQARAISIESM